MNESQSLLQRFFDASLIPADTGDERLEHYQAAAADIAKRFGETPSDAVAASRVAIDPKCPASEPWFAVVQEAVKVHWKTFLANHHDAPRQICRAILLEALSIAVADDDYLSAAVWNATSSLLPHLGSGPELTITREFISKLGDGCEAYSSEVWQIGGSSDGKPPMFEVKLQAVKASRVDEAALTNGMSDAAGPHNAESKNFGNPNQHWPNAASPWSYQFAPRAAKTIAAEVNKALAAITPMLKSINEQLDPALDKYATALGKWVSDSTQRNEQFTMLVWWKQALYSPSMKRSYRGLKATDISIATSFDLASVSGAPVPLSVEYFLREVIHVLAPENPRLTLADLVEAIRTTDPIEPCLPSPPTGTQHRVSLREFLALARQESPPAESVPTYVGIQLSTALPLSEWTVWLLRERLADILVTNEN